MQAVGRRELVQTLFALAAAVGPLAGCASVASRTAPAQTEAGVEAVSLLGEPLLTPAIPADTRARYEANLAQARLVFDQNPSDADAIIWLGRRTAYLGRYRESIEIFTDGITKHPNDPRMYRHRGHRYLTVREMDRAISDLSRAASLTAGKADEIEPDGIPNAANTPTSTLQSNIWYHLGLAHYIKGDFVRALSAYRRAMSVSGNPDMAVATSHWMYMTLRRLGRESEAEAVSAPISRDLVIIENDAYHRLLLLYKGALPPDSLAPRGDDALSDATVGYGLGNWLLYNGRRDDAMEVFQRIIAGGNWPSFGYLAAEAELARASRR